MMSEWERKERVRPEANILNDFFRKANKGEMGQKLAKLSEHTFYKWSRNYHEIVSIPCSNLARKVTLREAYRIYFMIGPLNLTIIYLLRVLLIRSTKTMIKIKQPQKIVGPKYSSAQNIRRHKFSSAQNIRRPKFLSPFENFVNMGRQSLDRLCMYRTEK